MGRIVIMIVLTGATRPTAGIITVVRIACLASAATMENVLKRDPDMDHALEARPVFDERIFLWYDLTVI